LPSCDLERELLADLETYIIHKSSEILGVEPRSCQENYEFTITDHTGTEKLKAVKDFDISHFPNSTSEVILDVESYQPRRLAIKLRFSELLGLTFERSYLDFDNTIL